MSRHLQNAIEHLKRDLLKLSALVEERMHLVVQSVQNRDGQLAQQIIDGDEEIDQAEVDIEEECQKILALHQPVAHDLRFIIASLKINNELERIGDLAVNIAERELFLSTRPPVDIHLDWMGMAEKTQVMLRKSIDALVNLDGDLALAVCRSDDEVDAMNRRMYAQIQEAIRSNPDELEQLIHILSISRHLERIADQATNIAEDVIYLIHGKIVRHHAEAFETLLQDNPR